MINGIHHINFIVRDLETAIVTWEKILGIPVTSRDTLEQRGVELGRFRLRDTWIILVQPVRPDTAPARYLDKHGEGFFLMSLETDSLEAEIARLDDALFIGGERLGIDDWRVIDLAADQTFGAQLQFVTTE